MQIFNEKNGYIISMGVSPMKNLTVKGDEFTFDGNMGHGLWHFTGRFDGDQIRAEAKHDELPDISTVVGKRAGGLNIAALVAKASQSATPPKPDREI